MLAAAPTKLKERMRKKLTDRHWLIIHFLRDQFEKSGVVPTVYETCRAHDLEIDEIGSFVKHDNHRRYHGLLHEITPRISAPEPGQPNGTACPWIIERGDRN